MLAVVIMERCSDCVCGGQRILEEKFPLMILLACHLAPPMLQGVLLK